MKKKIFRYITVCCSLIALFSLGNYYCYQSALQHFEKMQEDYESRLGEQVQVYVTNQMADQMEEWETKAQESVAADQVENVLTGESVFQVQSYDALTDTTVTEYEQLPEQLVGSGRQAAQEYCQTYKDTMSPEEFLNGLQTVSLVSFSKDRLVIRKSYDVSKVKFRYYLITDEEQLIVYYGDMKNVYEKTGILVESLSKEERKALKKGIEVKDEEELYGILENYST
jgi:hypothetical protein